MVAVRVRRRQALVAPVGVTVALLVAGCSGASPKVAVKPTTTVSPSTVPPTAPPGAATTTTIEIQASGPRTVLSPVGLNLRAQGSKSAAVVGTAAQGTTLTVLGHTGAGADGWYQVRGATVTGYITDNPVLSAKGKFTPYSSGPHNFSALYPEGWTTLDAPPASVVFHPQTGLDSIVVTTAATTGQLARGRAGYRQDSSAVMVVCGVTGNLVVFDQPNTSAPPSSLPGGTIAERYLAQVRLTLDAQHALGVDANFADPAQLQTVKDVVNSLSFPFPQCELGATPNPPSSTLPATTVG